MAKPSLIEDSIEDVVASIKPKQKAIIKKTIIDKFTIKAERVRLTPSVCDVCAMDIAKINKFEGWDRVPEENKEGILKALKAHKEAIHTSAEQLIVDEDQLPKSWLGNRAGV